MMVLWQKDRYGCSLDMKIVVLCDYSEGYGDDCEEAVMVMAWKWVKGRSEKGAGWSV